MDIVDVLQAPIVTTCIMAPVATEPYWHTIPNAAAWYEERTAALAEILRLRDLVYAQRLKVMTLERLTDACGVSDAVGQLRADRDLAT